MIKDLADFCEGSWLVAGCFAGMALSCTALLIGACKAIATVNAISRCMRQEMRNDSDGNKSR